MEQEIGGLGRVFHEIRGRVGIFLRQLAESLPVGRGLGYVPFESFLCPVFVVSDAEHSPADALRPVPVALIVNEAVQRGGSFQGCKGNALFEFAVRSPCSRLVFIFRGDQFARAAGVFPVEDLIGHHFNRGAADRSCQSAQAPHCAYHRAGAHVFVIQFRLQRSKDRGHQVIAHVVRDESGREFAVGGVDVGQVVRIFLFIFPECPQCLVDGENYECSGHTHAEGVA